MKKTIKMEWSKETKGTHVYANNESDTLVAHSHYKRVPHYRDLTPEQEWYTREATDLGKARCRYTQVHR